MEAKPIRELVVAVHGAASLSEAIAAALARAGAKVALLARDEAWAGATIRAINNGGGTADYAVTLGEHAEAIAAAGRAARGRFGRVDAWVEVDGSVAGAQAAAALLRHGGGVLIALTDAQAVAGTLRDLVARIAPSMTLAIVDPVLGADRTAIAAAVVSAVERPRPIVRVGAAGRRAGIRPAIAAAAGIGAVVATAGLVAWLRRRRDRA